MECIKIKIEFSVNIDVIKEVLMERGLEVSITNMKKVANVYKERQYTVTDKKFFEDFPKDKEILLMYGFKPKK